MDNNRFTGTSNSSNEQFGPTILKVCFEMQKRYMSQIGQEVCELKNGVLPPNTTPFIQPPISTL